MEFHLQTKEEALRTLGVHVQHGLSASEVSERLAEYGFNELKKKKGINPVILFLRQFRSFIIYILLFAVAVSILSGEYADATVILIILLFNAIFGFIQEYKAEKAIEALKALSALKSQAVRDGSIISLDSRELVPGDIIFLEEGNKISADARIIEAVRLQVSEASLTGESVPVLKHADTLHGELSLADRKNMVFSGTVVTAGKCTAAVTSTGMRSEIGKIAGMLEEVEDEATPLQRKLEHFGKWLGIGTIVICAIVFFVGITEDGYIGLLLSGRLLPFLFAAKEWLLIAVSLAVAAVPEGLPAIVTIALALGVRSMVKRNALIRRLPSVETLGETTIICSDKTGTLTKNEMTVRALYIYGKQYDVSGEGYSTKGAISFGGRDVDAIDGALEILLTAGVLCNSATLQRDAGAITGDPTEAALLVSAEKARLRHDALRSSWKHAGEEPFDSVRKMMSTLHIHPKTGRHHVFTKGAPEKILDACDRILVDGKTVRITDKHRKAVREANENLAKSALRVLGFAHKEHGDGPVESNLIFTGLQGMIDPPHKEVKDAVRRCHEAGIRIIMITGDNRHTAHSIANEIGIIGGAMDGSELVKLSKQKQLDALSTTSVFARVEPSHKMLIVELLQGQGHVVAMTGDGVNDAPAIKKADLGIAMGITGTDVAKEASDMVLQDDNFTSIVNAIEEGRGIYENIQKFINYLLSCNLGEVFIIFFAILFGMPLPMTAIMLLWLNVVTDGLPALALSVDPNSADLMRRPPKKSNEGIINKPLVFTIFFVSFLIAAGVLGIFFWAKGHYAWMGENEQFLQKIQTVAFTALIVMELVRLQAIRSEYKLGVFSNRYLVLAVMASFGLQLAVIYTPLSKFFGTVYLVPADWLLILAVSAGVFILTISAAKIRHRMGWLV